MNRILILLSLLAVAIPAESADPTPAFTRTIYLIRHGAYDTEAKAPEETGASLTPLGIAQARLIAARMRGMPEHFDFIASSTMTRARETAAVIHEMLPDVETQQSQLLSECTPPTRNERVAQKLKPGEADACAKQLNQAFREYFIPAKGAKRHELLICHGNVIRYFVTRALGVDTAAWLDMSVAHTSLTVIRVVGDGSYKVLSVGDVGHLPPNLQSGTSSSDPELRLPSNSHANTH